MYGNKCEHYSLNAGLHRRKNKRSAHPFLLPWQFGLISDPLWRNEKPAMIAG